MAHCPRNYKHAKQIPELLELVATYTDTAALLHVTKIYAMVHQMTPKIGTVPSCIVPKLYLDLTNILFMLMFCLLCYILTLNWSMIITKM